MDRIFIFIIIITYYGNVCHGNESVTCEFLQENVKQLEKNLQQIQYERLEDRQTLRGLIDMIHQELSSSPSKSGKSRDRWRKKQGQRERHEPFPQNTHRHMQETLKWLEIENRGLSQLDIQLRNVQSSLDRLIQEKNRESTVIQTFRQELGFVKSDMESVKNRMETIGSDENRASTATSSENTMKTIHWLFMTVNELKLDISQLFRHLNWSSTFQQFKQFQQEIQLIKNDLNRVNHRFTQDEMRQERFQVQLFQLQSDFNVLNEQQNRFQHELSSMISQFQSMKNDVNPSKMKAVGSYRVSSNESSIDRLTEEMMVMKTTMEKMENKQNDLEKQMDSWALIHIDDSKRWTENDAIQQLFRNATHHLQTKMNETESKLDWLNELAVNMTLNMAMLDKLEATQSTVYENIELIQEEHDLENRHLQTVLNQMQLNLTRHQVQQQQSSQDKERIKEKLNQLTTDVETMKNEQERDHLTLLMLQNRALNETLQQCHYFNLNHIQHVKMQELIQDIHLLQSMIQNMKPTLDNWNHTFVNDTYYNPGNDHHTNITSFLNNLSITEESLEEITDQQNHSNHSRSLATLSSNCTRC